MEKSELLKELAAARRSLIGRYILEVAHAYYCREISGNEATAKLARIRGEAGWGNAEEFVVNAIINAIIKSES